MVRAATSVVSVSSKSLKSCSKDLKQVGVALLASSFFGQSLKEWPFSRHAKHVVSSIFFDIRDCRRFSEASL